MTEQEAKKVASIMCTADGECYVCAGRLINQLLKMAPEHRTVILVEWQSDGWAADGLMEPECRP